MRQNTRELNLESSPSVWPPSLVTPQRSSIAELRDVKIFVLGADSAQRSIIYWQTLHEFWKNYFQSAKAHLTDYSVLRDFSSGLQ
jgi:hypothetical protein